MGELAGVGGDYWAAENFRTLHKVPLNYSLEELEADWEVGGESSNDDGDHPPAASSAAA